jgi:membrane-bound lytic murein transglycosylase B
VFHVSTLGVLIAKPVVVLLLLFASFLAAGTGALISITTTTTSSVLTGGPPSQLAVDDIPPRLLSAYQAAASTCPGLSWQVAAGIGKVESNHARFGGAELSADGKALPKIIGIPLNGSNGTARILDSDGGLLDGDTVFDRAVGPFQFIPTSWALFGMDGDRDGIRDPHDVDDAVPAMVRHLCPNGRITDVRAAIFSYNRSDEYVALVLSWASRYTAGDDQVADI